MRPNAGSTLEAWTEYIQSIHFRSIDLSLDRPRRVLHRLGLQQPNTVITVGGTNGKGTTVRLLETAYRSAGYSVGCYTSPHLISYCERLAINGVDVESQKVCNAFAAVDAARCDIPLTYFEFGTLAAFVVLAEEKIQVAILEVGMGGRLDAVNLLNADLAVITSVDLDHQAWLGTTRERIGKEKAGVFRYCSLAVVADPLPPHSVLEEVQRLKCHALVNGRDYVLRCEQNGQWTWALTGQGARITTASGSRTLPETWSLGVCSAVRAANVGGALGCVYQLIHRLPVSQGDIRSMFSAALSGRRERRPGPVPVWLDVAHNPHAVRALSEELRSESVSGTTRAVFAMLGDKDIESCVSLMSEVIDEWHLCELADERALTIPALRRRLTADCRVVDPGLLSATDVFCKVVSESVPGDRVVVFGSFYLVGDILKSLKNGALS